MEIFDAHCDLLSKLFEDCHSNFVTGQGPLQVSLRSLRQGSVKVQIFAIYIPSKVHPSMRFEAALSQVHFFYEKVIKEAGLIPIHTKEDILQLQQHQIGAILALEGCDCIDQDILKLQTLIQMGVKSVGLTWNFANAVADGAMEPRGAGLSLFGKEVVQLLNDSHLWCDVSHLSDQGFWDVMELALYPIASHSNSRAITAHPRNLTDDQIQALIQKDSVIGINFHSPFLTNQSQSSLTDIIRHIDHICELGGVKHIGMGSDFDGTETLPVELLSPANYQILVEELMKYYSEKEVKGFMFENFMDKTYIFRK